MRKIFISILTVASAICFQSCLGDFFDKPETTDVSEEEIFSSLEYTERALNYAYSSLPMGYPIQEKGESWALGRNSLEDLTDLATCLMTWGPAVKNFYSGTWTASQASSYGQGGLFNYNGEQDHWKAIRNTLLIEENIDKVPDATPEYKRQLVAQGKGIRAILYTHMFRIFGPVSWINEVIQFDKNFDPTGIDLSRPDLETMVNNIATLCDEAAADLPWVYDDPKNNEGRITKIGMMALKARLLLFAASPLFNCETPYYEGASESNDKHITWYGNYDVKRWEAAKKAHEEVLDAIAANGYYQLVQSATTKPYDYRMAYRNGYYSRTSTEMLIPVQHWYENPTNGFWQSFYGPYSWGTSKPTMEFLDLFPMRDGTPISDPASGYDKNNDPFGTYGCDKNDFKRDPRLYENAVVNQADWNGGKANAFTGKGGDNFLTQRKSCIISRKHFPEKNAHADPSVVYPYMRLPEIYLGYAEILNHLNGGPDAEAFAYLNKVRNRVGLKDIQEVKSSWTEEEFLEEVLNERAREFFGEEIRYYDMTRYKRQDLFQKKLHVVDITKEGAKFKHNYRLVTENKRFWVDDYDPQWLLQPIPLDEVKKNYGLVQNPGW